MNNDLVDQLGAVLWDKARQRYPHRGLGTFELQASYVNGCFRDALARTADAKALEELIHHHRQTPEKPEETAA